MDFNLIIVGTYSYLLGSIPFGLILTRIFLKKDIRKVGSGNIGTTNVLRTGNKSIALTTLILDLLKGYISVQITFILYEYITLYSAIICFMGHIFPVWLKFKGGKGVATYIGFLIGFNILLGLYFLVTWIIIALISRYSSLSSLAASLVAPLYFFFINPNNIVGFFLLYIFLIISLKHRENIKRLMNRSENKIKFSK